MDKQIVIHPYNGILFCNKKEQTTETCNNMDDFKKQYVEWYSHLQKPTNCMTLEHDILLSRTNPRALWLSF